MIQESKYFKIVNFADQIKDDSFSARQYELTDESNEPIVLTGATIVMTFYDQYNAVTKTVTNGSGITETDLANGIFTLDEFIWTYAAGVYSYYCTITYAGGDVKTYFGGFMTVIEK